jgi:hypothetical protein
MKKQILTLMVAAISITGFAQVGVGTADPQKALHIVGNGVRIENAAETSHYDLPDADGTAGQVLTTNGASAVTWAAAGAAAYPVSNFLTKNAGNDPFVLAEISTAITSIEFITSGGTFALTNLTAADIGKVIHFSNNAGSNVTITYNATNTVIFNNRAGSYLWNGTKWLRISYS